MRDCFKQDLNLETEMQSKLSGLIICSLVRSGNTSFRDVRINAKTNFSRQNNHKPVNRSNSKLNVWIGIRLCCPCRDFMDPEANQNAIRKQIENI